MSSADDDDDPYGPAPGTRAASAPAASDDGGAPSPTPGTDAALEATKDAEAGFETVDAEEEEGGPYRKANALERKLVMQLTSALKVSRLHALDNIVAKNVLNEFVGAVSEYLGKKDQATVIVGDGRVFINGAAMKGRRSGHSWLQDFVEFMARLGIGGLVLKGEWTLQSGQELLDVFAKVEAKKPEERVREIAGALRERLTPPAEVEVLDGDEAKACVAEGDDGQLDDAERAVFYFARLVALAEAGHVAAYHGRSPDFHVRHLRTTLMKIIEHLRVGLFQVRLLALGPMPPSEHDPVASHVAAVTTLSIAMGRLLGLSRGHLADLGFAALYHDLGRAVVTRAPSDEGAGEDPSTAEPHVTLGVALGLRGKGYGDAGLLRLIVGQEHHRVVDGYPKSAGLRRPHLYSRIVAVADAFSNHEVGTPWARPVSPAEALRRLRAEPDRYETPIVDVLEDVVGRIPRGTLLRLDDGATVIVIDGGARRGHRPIVRRLLDPDGVPDSRGTLLEVVDADRQEELAPGSVEVQWRRALLA